MSLTHGELDQLAIGDTVYHDSDTSQIFTVVGWREGQPTACYISKEGNIFDVSLTVKGSSRWVIHSKVTDRIQFNGLGLDGLRFK